MSSGPESPSRSAAGSRGGAAGRSARWEWTLLALTVIGGTLLRLDSPGAGYFNMHAARDCFRALEMIHGESFPLSGPEMFYGGRTPGWFYYLLLSVPLAFSPSPLGVTVWAALLMGVALLLCHLTCRRYLGPATGLAATALFAASPISVSMMRYMWNPIFLPPFNVAALLTLLLWRVEGRRWALGVFLIVVGLAFQIHFSAYVYLVPLLAFAPWRRGRRPGWDVLLVAAVALAPFFWPHVAHEMQIGGDTFTARVAATAAEPDRMFTAAPNPTALPQALQHIRVDLHEQTEPWRHQHFVHFMDTLEERHPRWLVFANAVELLSVLLVPFFVIGAVALALVALGRPRRAAARLEELFAQPAAARPLAWALWTWLGVSFAVLLFVGHVEDGVRLPIPARYFIIWYPLQFIVIALGMKTVRLIDLRRLRARGSDPAVAAPVWRQGFGPVLTAAIAVLALCQAGLALLFLRVSAASGATFYFSGQESRPCFNVGDKMAVADLLVNRHGLNLRAFRERFTTAGIYRDLHNEEFIDYELRCQPRFLTQPDPPPGLRFHLSDRLSPLRLPVDKIHIESIDGVGELRVITYRVTDPDLVIPLQVIENPYMF